MLHVNKTPHLHCAQATPSGLYYPFLLWSAPEYSETLYIIYKIVLLEHSADVVFCLLQTWETYVYSSVKREKEPKQSDVF